MGNPVTLKPSAVPIIALVLSTVSLTSIADHAAALEPRVVCHDIGGYKFAELDLAEGIATPGGPGQTEVWTVTCPAGADPCPPAAGSLYTPYYNGEHVVEYVLYSSDEGVVDQCTYRLRVGPPGFQSELAWEWDETLGSSTVDLDLHLHRPASTAAWGVSSATSENCAWSNCRVWDFNPVFPNPNAPYWFFGSAPPDPVTWYLSPVFEENTCYLMPAPQGGNDWQLLGMGCHNPRLSLDNVSCDPIVTDPNDADYCHVETVNIDFMPLGEWTRVGVHYYSNHGQSYDVHPKVSFFCHRELMVVLGDAVAVGSGYSQEVTFSPADGGDLFWIVADVVFLQHPQTSDGICIVRPIYGDDDRAPFFTSVAGAQASIGPPYAEVPVPVFWDGFETGDAVAWAVAVP